MVPERAAILTLSPCALVFDVAHDVGMAQPGPRRY